MRNLIIIRVADLSHAGEGFLSRGKGKELTSHLSDRDGWFALSFEGIDQISPSFADQVFRVFLTSRPDVTLVVMNACQNVYKMIHGANKSIEQIELRATASN